jgi:dephospho-CoA kinase
MYKLGITGGIGSGKTTACKFFKTMGAVIFDADIEAKIILENELIAHHIIKEFGTSVTKNNTLNLELLSQVAFQSKKNQNTINRIIWPEVLYQIQQKVKLAKDSGNKLFIVDAALLLEANFQNFFDSILLVTAKTSIRYKRILKRNNIPEKQIENRMKLQMPEEKKEQMVNYTITNNMGIIELNNKLKIFFKSLKL